LNKIYKIFSFILFFLVIINHTCNTNDCFSQWVQTNGPYGGGITCFASIGNTIFAGSSGAGSSGSRSGIFYSTNNGLNWIPGGLSDRSILVLKSSGSNLYAGTYGQGIFKSTDNGISWNLIGLLNQYIGDLLIIDNNIFAATQSGIFLYNGIDTSWQTRNNGLTSIYTSSITINGSKLFTGTNLGFFTSTNNGLNWIQTNNNLNTHDIRKFLFLDSTNYLIGTYDSGIYRTSNDGLNWSKVNGVINGNYILFLNLYNNIIYTGISGEGVFYSADYGINWHLLSNELSNQTINSFLFYNNNFLAGKTGEGIFLSMNNGVNWTSVGLPYQYVTAFASLGTNIYVCCPDIGIFHSSNNGTSWNLLRNGLSYNLNLTALTTLNSNLFAGAYSGGIFMSSDSGLSWSHIYPNNISCWILKSYKGNIYAGSSTGLFYSTDGGSNWIYSGISHRIISLAILDSAIIAGTNGYGIYRTTNNGINWTESNAGLEGYTINGLESNGQKILAGTEMGVYNSTNKGLNWSLSGLYGYLIGDIKILNNNVFACAWKNIFLSTDFGNNWSSINTGFNKDDVMNPLLITNNFLFCGSDYSSVWRRPINEVIGIKNISTNIPDKYFLFQNYPNPFNPTTKIKYQIPKSSSVKLIVYDILGKEVAKLVDQKQNAGSYETHFPDNQFSNNDLPSGVYFYLLFIDGVRLDTKKLIFLK